MTDGPHSVAPEARRYYRLGVERGMLWGFAVGAVTVFPIFVVAGIVGNMLA